MIADTMVTTPTKQRTVHMGSGALASRECEHFGLQPWEDIAIDL
jgi:hypothetical protein